MKSLIINFFALFVILILLSGSGFSNSGTWHPELTQRPRILFKAAEKDGIINRIKNDDLFRSLYKNLYNSIFETADTRAELAMVTKNAAFVYAINFKPSGNTIVLLSSSERENLKKIVLDGFKNANISVSSVFNFDDWQYRAKEVISYCEAFDLLAGSGISSEELWQNGGEEIHNFVANLYSEVNNSLYQNYAPYNNFRLITGAALVISAISFNNVGSSDVQEQPANWVSLGLYNIDKTLWDYQSHPDIETGYSESTYYLTYAMKFAIPAIVGLKNFLGDFTENFSGRTVRSPWYDPKYKKLFNTITKLKLPDGRVTPIENSYLDAMFPELAILGKMPGNSNYYSWNLSDRNYKKLDYSLSSTYDLRADYICNAVNFSNPPENWKPTQFLPEAGSIVMRSSWDTLATFLHVTGKHGRARDANSSLPSGHNHADETSFILFAGGKMLSLHPGYYHYDQSNELKWGENHNLILVDGLGPDSSYAASSTGNYIYGTDAYIKNYFSHPQTDFAEVFTNYQNTDFRRSILFPQKSFFIIIDEIKSNTNRTFTFQLHGNGLADDGTYEPNFSQNETKWFCEDMILKAKVLAEDGNELFSTVNKKHAPHYRTWEYHSALHVDKIAVNTKFLTILFPYHRNETEPVFQKVAVENGTGAVINSDNWNTFIAIKKKDEIISYKNGFANNKKISTDGRLLFSLYEMDHSENYSTFFQEGTYLAVGYDTLICTANKSSIYTQVVANHVIMQVLNGDGYMNTVFLKSVKSPETVVGENVSEWKYDNDVLRIDVHGQSCELKISFSTVSTNVSNSIDKIPSTFSLLQNYPNPFSLTGGSQKTDIFFIMSQPEFVALSIFNDKGQLVKRLTSREFPAGQHKVQWDGRDEPGRKVVSGLYFYSLHSKSFNQSRKMILLR